MQFYIYQKSSWVEKKIQLQAISEDVKDETLDTACVQIYFDDEAEPYAPRTLCKTIDGETSYYHIATDNVEIQTLDPRTYKHTLTLVQTTRKLSHYVLPNMVITRPRESVVSTYFTNLNTLNLPYYFNNKETEGIYTWDGFTSNYIRASNSQFLGGCPSPYWGECVAVTEHQKFSGGKIKLYWNAIVCSAKVDSDTHEATSAEATYVKLVRKIATPSWKDIYIVVYHCDNNVNRVVNDSAIKNRVDLVKIPLDDIDWQGEYGFYNLTSADIDLINGYNKGYIMCELVCNDTSAKPDKFWYTPATSSTKVTLEASCDRLFCDKDEYTEHGVQAIWSRLSLELYSKQNTLYEVLQRILNRQQCKHDYSQNAPLFNLPTSGDDYEVLTTTASPEFTFTNLTVFEAVSQVLETIDALPRFDTNDDGTLTLGLDYFAETGKLVPLATKFTSYISNATEQKRDNGIVTNFQGAETYSYFPCKPYDGLPIFARARVKSYGIPEYTDFVLAVDKPIKYVNHLWVKLLWSFNVIYDKGQTVPDVNRPYYGTYEVTNISVPVDLASFVFDESTYSSSLEQGDYSTTNHNQRLQLNCLKYKQGSKEISIGEKGNKAYDIVYNTLWNCIQISSDRMMGYWGQNFDTDFYPHYGNKDLITRNYPTENVFCDIYFSCEYGTDLDGRLEIQSPYPKESGQFISSTGSSSPDLGKLGLNMLGVALKSGEPTMTCTQMLGTWDNRIKIGDVFTKNKEKWIATKASYTRLGQDVIKGTIEFTKNFNGLSKRIAIDQSKRLYNIDRSIASLCEANIFTYVYFEPVKAGGSMDTFVAQNTPFAYGTIGKMAMKAFTTDDTKYLEPSYAYVTTISGGTQVAYQIYIPLAVYGAGNCLCFETKFSDPISAGIKMNVSGSGSTYWWLTDEVAKAYKDKYYYGSDVKYTDSEGYAEYFQIEYLTPDTNENGFPNAFPDCALDLVGDYLGKITNLAFDKQPNEIFGLNYEIAFLSRYTENDNQVFFTQRFFDTWNDRKGLRTTQAIFYYSTSETYDYSDTKGKGSAVLVDVGFQTNVTGKYGQFYFTQKTLPKITATFNLTSFAICDQDGNILIACNCEGADCLYTEIKNSLASFPTLCFFARQERL